MKRINYVKLVSVTFIVSLFFSCSTKLKYIGNVYEPSEDVKLYFEDADITEEHQVMGRIYVKFKENKNIESIQRSIIAKVKAVGGDAVLMGELNEEVVGSVTGRTGGVTKVGKKSGVGTSVSKTKNQYKDEIECQVIKYK